MRGDFVVWFWRRRRHALHNFTWSSPVLLRPDYGHYHVSWPLHLGLVCTALHFPGTESPVMGQIGRYLLNASLSIHPPGMYIRKIVVICYVCGISTVVMQIVCRPGGRSLAAPKRGEWGQKWQLGLLLANAQGGAALLVWITQFRKSKEI